MDMLQDDLDEYVKANEERKAELERLTQEKIKAEQDVQTAASEVITIVKIPLKSKYYFRNLKCCLTIILCF